MKNPQEFHALDKTRITIDLNEVVLFKAVCTYDQPVIYVVLKNGPWCWEILGNYNDFSRLMAEINEQKMP